MLYTFAPHPVTEKLTWLRYDTHLRGQVLKYPYAVAELRDLAPIPPVVATRLRTAISRRYMR